MPLSLRRHPPSKTSNTQSVKFGGGIFCKMTFFGHKCQGGKNTRNIQSVEWEYFDSKNHDTVILKLIGTVAQKETLRCFRWKTRGKGTSGRSLGLRVGPKQSEVKQSSYKKYGLVRVRVFCLRKKLTHPSNDPPNNDSGTPKRSWMKTVTGGGAAV